MEATALFFALAFSAVVNFSYLANVKEYKIKKYFTAFALLAMGYFLMNQQDNIIVVWYWIFTGIMLLISGAMNREKRGKKIFQLPTFPSFKTNKKKATKKRYEDKEKSEHIEDENDRELQKRERLIEQLQKENEALRSKSLNNVEDLDEWERIRKQKLEE